MLFIQECLVNVCIFNTLAFTHLPVHCSSASFVLSEYQGDNHVIQNTHLFKQSYHLFVR